MIGGGLPPPPESVPYPFNPRTIDDIRASPWLTDDPLCAVRPPPDTATEL